ncbi:MAG TPA: glycosyltransferase family 4 protein [Pyrinomonadaceae bacterium]|nr:glycosyltransferase family 4 protein [Pyrinomonadaceae bacterium]HRK48896.1 glycosyltransferase family 4 protein [Pyrinomonadaceae bacterium]
MKRIAAFVPNKLGVSPGQRVRIEAWAPHLQEFGWQIDWYPFEDDALHELLYKPGRSVAKAKLIASNYIRHLGTVLNGLECDGLFIYREAALIGPALLERRLKQLRVPMIYDIDDPIFLPYKSPVNSWGSLLKFSRKTHSLFKMSDRVISINNLIGDYARKFNSAVSIVPNCVDTGIYRPVRKDRTARPKIVWTGSVSTLQNLQSVAGPLRAVQAEYGCEIIVIANGETEVDGVDIEYRSWSPEVEISSLQECDIGIVPLLDLDWNPWKFFLKTVQYLAAGLPVVARRIGSNSEVIQDGVNGFLVDNEEGWFDRLGQLINDPALRQRMSNAARKSALAEYSLDSQIPRVASIFREVYGGND